MGVRFLWLLLCVSLLVCCAKEENRDDPTANVNLAPFQQWISAYWCLKKPNKTCQDKYVLQEIGWLNVTNNDTKDFCKPGGCGERTRDVLNCIRYVKRDYWFANGASLDLLFQTIYNGCNTSEGFNGVSLYQKNGYEKRSASIITALLAFVLLGVFI